MGLTASEIADRQPIAGNSVVSGEVFRERRGFLLDIAVLVAATTATTAFGGEPRAPAKPRSPAIRTPELSDHTLVYAHRSLKNNEDAPTPEAHLADGKVWIRIGPDIYAAEPLLSDPDTLSFWERQGRNLVDKILAIGLNQGAGAFKAQADATKVSVRCKGMVAETCRKKIDTFVVDASTPPADGDSCTECHLIVTTRFGELPCGFRIQKLPPPTDGSVVGNTQRNK